MNVVIQQRQRLFREGLGQLLQAQEDLAVVGIASTVCQEHRPDVAVLEADAVEWDPGRVARNLRRAVPSMRIIGLSAGEMSRAEVARAHRDGIRDVLPRSAGIGRILAAVRATSALHRVRPQAASASSGAPAESSVETVLTPRELTILNLVGAGFTWRATHADAPVRHD